MMGTWRNGVVGLGTQVDAMAWVPGWLFVTRQGTFGSPCHGRRIAVCS